MLCIYTCFSCLPCVGWCGKLLHSCLIPILCKPSSINTCLSLSSTWKPVMMSHVGLSICSLENKLAHLQYNCTSLNITAKFGRIFLEMYDAHLVSLYVDKVAKRVSCGRSHKSSSLALIWFTMSIILPTSLESNVVTNTKRPKGVCWTNTKNIQ